MPKKLTREQIWKLYEKLPQELQDVFFSQETGDVTHEICKRNEVLEKLSDIVEYVGQVLLGVLPPDEFQQTLEKEVGLEKDVAKKVSREINRFIFYPVKSSLEQLYKIEIAPPAKPVFPQSSKISPESLPDAEEEKTEKPDIYREAIE